MRQADWYFDFISPYAYLLFHKMQQLPDDVAVTCRPILFAGLLNHWGQLGPAEIPAKKSHTFLLTQWRAQQLGLAFKAPPRHPFNPLTILRLAIAKGSDRDTIGVIFDHIWGTGNDGQSPESMATLAVKLGVDNVTAATGDQAVKDALRENTEAAIAIGAYGVPSFVIDGTLFWGDDMLT